MVNKESIELKNVLMDRGISGLALDIDETLSWTVGYWVKLMQEKFGNPENLSPIDMVNKYHYTQNVPYWQNEEAKRFNDLLIDNPEYYNCELINGAQEYVRLVNQIIPIKAYITTRPSNIVEYSKKWLNDNGFPEAPIIARPSEVARSEANAWKAENLVYLYPQIRGIVDDSVKLLSCLPENYGGDVFVFDNREVDRKYKFACACQRWEDVYLAVKDMLK